VMVGCRVLDAARLDTRVQGFRGREFVSMGSLQRDGQGGSEPLQQMVWNLEVGDRKWAS
jgi:hypothetical protein